ncbi:MAG: hypothetical protein WAW18_10880, partial [Trichococcus flocculiformis]
MGLVNAQLAGVPARISPNAKIRTSPRTASASAVWGCPSGRMRKVLQLFSWLFFCWLAARAFV